MGHSSELACFSPKRRQPWPSNTNVRSTPMHRHDTSMCMKSFSVPRMARVLIAGLCAATLAACGDTLVYGERTGFNLAVEVNQDPSTPVNVNLGLHRTVVGVVPPVDTESEEQQGESRPSGEAVSMISGFDLSNEDKTNQLDPELQIRTQFASGEAAVEVSGNDLAVAAIARPNIIRTPEFASERTRNKVDQLISKSANLDDTSMIRLASNPPVTDPEVDSAIEDDIDPNDRRANDPVAAFHVLKARLYLAEAKDLSLWNSAIDLALQ